MVNRVILVGNLTADPEVRATPKGVYVANLRMATNTYAGKDEAGEAKEKTEFLVGRLRLPESTCARAVCCTWRAGCRPPHGTTQPRA